MAFVSSAFERKIIPLRDERGALFIRDRNSGHHEISDSRPIQENFAEQARLLERNFQNMLENRLPGERPDRHPAAGTGGSEPHLDFVVTDLDRMLAQLCGPGALGCGQGFRAARLQSNFVVLTSHVSARLGSRQENSVARLPERIFQEC